MKGLVSIFDIRPQTELKINILKSLFAQISLFRSSKLVVISSNVKNFEQNNVVNNPSCL